MAALSLNLQPGFKFSPTDVQIIDYYLRLKITGNDEELYFIREVQLTDEELYVLQTGARGYARYVISLAFDPFCLI
jgi:hypothetical protein